VMDSGVRVSHNEFGGRAFWAYNENLVECNGNRRCSADTNGHGTHVAGAVAGRTVGVAPEATIWALKPGPEASDLYLHMDWIGRKRVTPAVLSLSIGYPTGPPAPGAEKAVDALVARGVVVVVAAGNAGVECSGSDTGISFAAHDRAIAVGSVDASNKRSNKGRLWASNYGTTVDIFAPGEDINSASNTSDTSFALLSGTSMATPQVSGAVALILQANRNLWNNPGRVKELLVGMSQKKVVANGKSKDDNLLDVAPLAGGGPVPAPPATAPPPAAEYDFWSFYR